MSTLGGDDVIGVGYVCGNSVSVLPAHMESAWHKVRLGVSFHDHHLPGKQPGPSSCLRFPLSALGITTKASPSRAVPRLPIPLLPAP